MNGLILTRERRNFVDRADRKTFVGDFSLVLPATVTPVGMIDAKIREL
jgi:hypothetical protein